MSSAQSVPALLRQRAEQWPDQLAFTFIDYEVDQSGYAETLTWSQLLQRTEAIAVEVAAVASPGDQVG